MQAGGGQRQAGQPTVPAGTQQEAHRAAAARIATCEGLLGSLLVKCEACISDIQAEAVSGMVSGQPRLGTAQLAAGEHGQQMQQRAARAGTKQQARHACPVHAHRVCAACSSHLDACDAVLVSASQGPRIGCLLPPGCPGTLAAMHPANPLQLLYHKAVRTVQLLMHTIAALPCRCCRRGAQSACLPALQGKLRLPHACLCHTLATRLPQPAAVCGKSDMHHLQ